MWPRRQGNDPVAKPDLLFARKERPVARRHRGTAKSRGGPDGYTGQRSVLRHRAGRRRRERDARSEEHTSELQSLMRISYAVFCLKKKNQMKRSRTKLNKTIYITSYR